MPENTNLVEDVEILLPVEFSWIPFSGFSWVEFIGVLRHNEISVIYVTTQMCRRFEEEVVPTVRLPTP